MSKYFKLAFIFVILLIILFLGFALNWLHFSNDTYNFIPKKSLDHIHIGVIQSTQNKNIAYVSFYDKSLNFIYEKTNTIW